MPRAVALFDGLVLGLVLGLVGGLLLGSRPGYAQSGLPPVDRPQAVQPLPDYQEPEVDPEAAPESSTVRRDLLNRASTPALQAEMALQRKLLAEDLLSYSDLRDSERQRWRQVDDLKTEIDIALADDALLRQAEALLTVQLTERRLESAVGEAESATARARELRRQIVERVRKLHLLERELDRLEPAAERTTDPLTGRWEITSRPDFVTGVFDLVLDGTQVSGRYRLSNGRRGSLRGRFTGRDLHLERVDRERGFDAVFDGTLSLERERITGFWRPTDVSGGAAGGGDWWAEKPDEEDGSPESVLDDALEEEQNALDEPTRSP